jgi:hypothetical protein
VHDQHHERHMRGCEHGAGCGLAAAAALALAAAAAAATTTTTARSVQPPTATHLDVKVQLRVGQPAHHQVSQEAPVHKVWCAPHDVVGQDADGALHAPACQHDATERIRATGKHTLRGGGESQRHIMEGRAHPIPHQFLP